VPSSLPPMSFKIAPTITMHESSPFFLQCFGVLKELTEDGEVVTDSELFVNRITPISLERLESISVCTPGSDPPCPIRVPLNLVLQKIPELAS
jgi:hypothetical protein